VSRERERGGPGSPPLPLVWTLRALANLETISDFIERDNPRAAEHWFTLLASKADSIPDMPFRGRIVPEYRREDVRELVLRNYRMVYRIRVERIEILTVFEAHREIPLELDD